MKALVLAAVLLAGSTTAFAQAAQIAGKVVSSGVANPRTMTASGVMVYANGSVEVEKTKKGKQTSKKAKLPKASVAVLVACSRAAAKAKQLPATRCQGGAYTAYMLGSTTLSRKVCGKTETMKVACAGQAKKILDAF